MDEFSWKVCNEEENHPFIFLDSWGERKLKETEKKGSTMQSLTSALQLAPELSVCPLLGDSAASHPLKQMLPQFGPILTAKQGDLPSAPGYALTMNYLMLRKVLNRHLLPFDHEVN